MPRKLNIVKFGNSDKFLEGQIKLCEPIPDKYILRANAKEQQTYITLEINGIKHKAICVENHCYVPYKTVMA